MTGRGARIAVAALCAGAALAACSTGATQGPGTTVTVTRSEPPTSTVPTTTTSSTAPVHRVTTLPGTCFTLLPLSAVEDALGRAISGHTAFVVGAGEPGIGRITYLNCRYGLPVGAAAATATPKLEITVSLYRTALFASRRIPETVNDYANHGASQSDVAVAGVHAIILTRASGNGYTYPTIVAAFGQRTIAITLVPKPGANLTKDLSALAKVALQATAS
ncbi:MAG: hypothetical protein ACRDWT_15835 [Jatrophihabitantaceae bacterium]